MKTEQLTTRRVLSICMALAMAAPLAAQGTATQQEQQLKNKVQDFETMLVNAVRHGRADRRPESPRAALVPPSSPVVSYDERTMTVTWTPTEPSQIFRIYRADSTGKEVLPALTPGPIGTPLYSAPVEFGVERCFVVHSTIARGTAVVESEPTAPVCKTPADTFPPAAPDGLIALPSEGKIQLKWNAVDAADLAGYLVLRAEGAAAPEPVTASPVSETAFDDTTTKAGVRYVYVVVAVDKAGNRSPSSNQVEETAR